jgi:FkbM family methyltransferase
MFSTKTKIKIAKILFIIVSSIRRTFRLKNTGVFRRRGLNWDLDLSQGIDFAIFLQGSFEPETVRFYSKIIKPGDIVIDIGANIGAHTLHFAQLVGPMGRVIAFEPTDYAFSKLQRNLELNPVLRNRVLAMQVLLDSGEGIKPESIPSSWELLGKSTNRKHTVHLGTYNSVDSATTRTLDSVLSELAISRVQFIKLDVDGYELSVLKGAKNALENATQIIMEICPYIYQEHGYTLSDILDLLNQYKMYDFKNRKVMLENIPEKGGVNVYLKKGKS